MQTRPAGRAYLVGTGMSVFFVMIPHDVCLRHDGVHFSLLEKMRAISAALMISYVSNESIVQ
jgi:hypothetical protein